MSWTLKFGFNQRNQCIHHPGSEADTSGLMSFSGLCRNHFRLQLRVWYKTPWYGSEIPILEICMKNYVEMSTKITTRKKPACPWPFIGCCHYCVNTQVNTIEFINRNKLLGLQLFLINWFTLILLVDSNVKNINNSSSYPSSYPGLFSFWSFFFNLVIDGVCMLPEFTGIYLNSFCETVKHFMCQWLQHYPKAWLIHSRAVQLQSCSFYKILQGLG